MEDKEITENESLELITQMIQTAKHSFSDDGIYYLIWGWAVLIAALGEFMLIQLNVEAHYLPWMLMPLTGVIFGIIGRRKTKQKRVRTFVEEFIGYVWIAFGISLFIVLIFMAKFSAEVTYPIILVLYGIGTFISGGALKFKPLLIGGIFCWSLSIAAFFLPFQYQLLLIAAAVLAAYIIPGHMLQSRYRQQQMPGISLP